MKVIKEYLESLRFSLAYSFRFASKETGILGIINIFLGVLPYATAFLLGKLVDSIVSGSQHASSSGLWPILLLYAFVSSLPALTGNMQRYFARRRMSKMQVGMELEIVKMRERIDIAKYEEPKFLDLLQRTFRNGPNPVYQLSIAQFDTAQSVTSLVIGTALAIHFNWIIYLVVIVTAVPAFIVDIKFAGQSWSIWSKDSPDQRRMGDLRQHVYSRFMLIETKLMQSSNKIFSWMHKILSEFSIQQIGLEKKVAWYASITDLLSLVGFVCGLVLVVKGTVSGVTQVGSVVYIIGTLTTVRRSIANLLSDVSGQFENHLIVKDMIEVYNTRSDFPAACRAVPLRKVWKPLVSKIE